MSIGWIVVLSSKTINLRIIKREISSHFLELCNWRADFIRSLYFLERRICISNAFNRLINDVPLQFVRDQRYCVHSA